MTGPSLSVEAAVIMAGGLSGAFILRHLWTQRPAGRLPYLLAGWGLLLASLIWPAFAMGPARGPFVALALLSIAALLVVAQNYQIRKARAGGRHGGDGLAPEPQDRPGTPWRTTLRWLLAGPIGMVAALALAIAFATWTPGETQTRLLLAGLLVPVLWGGAMAWTLADHRIGRATAVLMGTAVVGFAISILKGFT